jgi:hypothetical protein
VVTAEQEAWLCQVRQNVQEAIARGETIKLPDFQRNGNEVSSEVALLTVGIEPNPFGGTLDEYRYQFEGEEDLLHVFVVRQDLQPFACEVAQLIVQRLLPDVPPAFIYLKPGERSHHFYLGHDWLVQ